MRKKRDFYVSLKNGIFEELCKGTLSSCWNESKMVSVCLCKRLMGLLGRACQQY